MAGDYLCPSTSATSGPVTIEDLLHTAKTHEWTLLGELFSADDVARLAECALGLKASVQAWKEPKQILDVLFKGGLILAAYDPDVSREALPMSKKSSD